MPIGEASLADLKTRPDYAITVHDALAGFVEVKAPGKGADPRRFREPHDRERWERLRSLPNLIYTDGNAFSLWRNGELVGQVLKLEGDVESAGDKLAAPPGLLALFESFLRWEPLTPRTAKELAHVVARLCRLLRDEVTEQLAVGNEALTALATDWRNILFPDASDERFADGYAQAVTFGLLMSRAIGISFREGLQQAATRLSVTSTLIGEALRLLTYDADNQKALRTSLGTLTRVLEAVDWSTIRRRGQGAGVEAEHAKAETWLYFYEDFLEVYDNDLRKRTGSYTRRRPRVLAGGWKAPTESTRPPLPSRSGCLRRRGRSERMPSTYATSTSTSGAGPHGRSSTTTPTARQASSASSAWRGPSTARASRRCGGTCGGGATRSGSSTARPRDTSPKRTRGSSRTCSSRSASCSRPGPPRRTGTSQPRSGSGRCRRATVRRSSRLSRPSGSKETGGSTDRVPPRNNPET